MAVKQPWFVYMLRCADGSLYSGITTDVVRRVQEHNTDQKGAKYTKARRPVQLMYQKRCKDRSDAATKEASLKKLTRKEKLNVIEKN